MKKRTMKLLVCLTVLVLAGTVFAVPAFAAGDVATAIEQTWKAAQTQIKNVVNNVVFSGSGHDPGNPVFCEIGDGIF